MGFTLSRTTKLLATLSALLIVGACSETAPGVAEEDEIKSINVFFSKEDVAGSVVGKAYSYSAESGLSTELATINNAANSVVVMDTNEEDAGLEFAAYAEGRTLKLINYAKGAITRIYTLETYSADICGLYPVRRPAKTAYETDSDYYLKTIEDTAVYVALKTETSCSRNTDAYRLVDYDISATRLIQQSRAVTSAEVFGGFIHDPSYTTKDDDGEEIKGRSVWIGHNRDTQKLIGREYLGNILFEASLAYKSDNKPSSTPETPPPYVVDLGTNRVIVQQNQKAYNTSEVLQSSTANLYDLNLQTLNQLLEQSDTVSPDNVFSAYFAEPFTTITISDQTSPVAFSISGIYLAFDDDVSVFRHELDTGQTSKLFDKSPALQSVKYAALGSGVVAVQKTFSAFHSMSFFSLSDTPVETFAINSADDMSFRARNDRIYVNALRPSNVLNNPITSPTWVLARLNSNRVDLMVEGGTLAFIDNPIENDDIIMLTSTTPPVDEVLTTPSVYLFDGDQPNGIFTFRDEEEGEVLSTNFTQAKIGKLTTDIVNVSNELFGAGFEINREFAGFQVETGNTIEGYYYSPAQTSTEEDSRTPSLASVRSSSSEPITLNGFTVTEQQSGLVSEQQ